MKDFNTQLQDAIKTTQDCYQTCLETQVYCIQQGGHHVSEQHMSAMMDCVKTCSVTAEFMIRESKLYPAYTQICIEACRRCATECEQMKNDGQMQACAEMCRTCEQACEQLLNTLKNGTNK